MLARGLVALRRNMLFLAGTAVMAIAAMASPTHAAVIDLFGYGFNVDGNIGGNGAGGTTTGLEGAVPPGVNLAGFTITTGLGTILITVSGAGAHHVGLFVDHEIDEGTNSAFNEQGSFTGAAAVGQHWEIDEPVGMIQTDVINLPDLTFWDVNYLDLVPSAPDCYPAEDLLTGCDVSMAMSFVFNLLADQTATIAFNIAETLPTTPFYLTQFDPDSDARIHLSGALSIQDNPPPGVPEPGMLALFAAGLSGIAVLRRRRRA
jgi:hypothetical protein